MPVISEVVHILRYGKSLCPMSSRHGVPANWPEGHRWVGFQDPGEATCTACRLIWNRENSGRPA